MADPARVYGRVLRFALALPEAYEDHPWEETVVKVGKKIFVFLGQEDGPGWPSMSVKLADSHEQALAIPGAEPTGYGLARGGWVTIRSGPPSRRSASSPTSSRRATGSWPQAPGWPALMPPRRRRADRDEPGDGRAARRRPAGVGGPGAATPRSGT